MTERPSEPIPSILTEQEWRAILEPASNTDQLSEADKRMIEALQRGVNWSQSGMMVSIASEIDPNETFRL
jgi:hypothetical protein